MTLGTLGVVLLVAGATLRQPARRALARVSAHRVGRRILAVVAPLPLAVLVGALTTHSGAPILVFLGTVALATALFTGLFWRLGFVRRASAFVLCAGLFAEALSFTSAGLDGRTLPIVAAALVTLVPHGVVLLGALILVLSGAVSVLAGALLGMLGVWASRRSMQRGAPDAELERERRDLCAATRAGEPSPRLDVVVERGPLGLLELGLRRWGGRVLDRFPGGVLHAELPLGLFRVLDILRLIRPGLRVESTRRTVRLPPRLASTAPATSLDDLRRRLFFDEHREAGDPGCTTCVAIVDTGVNEISPLRGKILASYNYSGSASDRDVADHGTSVAVLVDLASRGSARFLSYKVLSDEGSGTTLDILRAVRDIGARGDVDVANLSLGGGCCASGDCLLCRAVSALARQLPGGVVVAAGNSGPDAGSITCPARGADVLTAAAVDADGAPARFSSRGPVPGREKPDCAAPGVALALPGCRGAVRSISGTSFASPLVAGVVALIVGGLRSRGHRPQAREVADRVRASTVARPEWGRDDIGVGEVNAARAWHALPSSSGAFGRLLRPALSAGRRVVLQAQLATRAVARAAAGMALAFGLYSIGIEHAADIGGRDAAARMTIVGRVRAAEFGAYTLDDGTAVIHVATDAVPAPESWVVVGIERRGEQLVERQRLSLRSP